MRLLATSLVIAAVVMSGCGKTETVQPTPAPEQVAESSTAPPPPTGEDPEPSDAQAKAEAVVNADFNRNKITTLKMNITTLVDGRTSSITGFAPTGLTASEEKIEDKLGRLSARVTETEITIPLPGAILFDFDSAAIRPDAARTLADVKAIVESYSGRPVRIEGHTDSVASDEYNQRLSEQRAKSVGSWLISNGVASSRVATAGLGETKPVASNDTAAGRQQNRRVEIVIARK